eukprot:427087-Prorocentrum_minimum.AAC.1
MTSRLGFQILSLTGGVHRSSCANSGKDALNTPDSCKTCFVIYSARVDVKGYWVDVKGYWVD